MSFTVKQLDVLIPDHISHVPDHSYPLQLSAPIHHLLNLDILTHTSPKDKNQLGSAFAKHKQQSKLPV